MTLRYRADLTMIDRRARIEPISVELARPA